MGNKGHILVTGGAGYLGSMLVSELLREGYTVTVVDNLLYGGESLLPCFSNSKFHFSRADVTEANAVRFSLRKGWPRPEAVIHLAGIAGFPACQAVGKQAAWKYNVEAVKNVYSQAARLGCKRFLFPSTYSNYGPSQDGKPVTEESPLQPQSLYAETKVAAEDFLLSQGKTEVAPLIFRLPSLFGISPRTRFDLLVNQFVLDAYTKRELIIYQRGYMRSFLHVQDAARGMILGLQAPLGKVRGQVFNLGSKQGNYTKDEIVSYVIKRLPETFVTYKDLTFGGDVRDIKISFDKVAKILHFKTTFSVDDGVREIVYALHNGVIKNPLDEKYTNARFLIQ